MVPCRGSLDEACLTSTFIPPHFTLCITIVRLPRSFSREQIRVFPSTLSVRTRRQRCLGITFLHPFVLALRCTHNPERAFPIRSEPFGMDGPSDKFASALLPSHQDLSAESDESIIIRQLTIRHDRGEPSDDNRYSKLCKT